MRTVELPLPSANAALLPRPLFTIRWPARPAQTAQARPAALNDQVTALRGRQASLTSGATAALPAVRPTAAQSRGARPRRPGTWGRRVAPYNEASRSKVLTSTPRSSSTRPAHIQGRRSLSLATAPVLQAGSGNMAGNSAKRGTGQHGRFPFQKFLRAALPGRSGPAMRHSLTVRIAYACPAIGGAVRSAQKFLEGKTTFTITKLFIVSCPFPAILLRPAPAPFLIDFKEAGGLGLT